MKNFNKFFAISLFSVASISLAKEETPTTDVSTPQVVTGSESTTTPTAPEETPTTDVSTPQVVTGSESTTTPTAPTAPTAPKARTWSEFGSESWTSVKSTVAYPFVKINAGCNVANEYVFGKVNTESNFAVNALRGYSAQTIVVATAVAGLWLGYNHLTQPTKKQANKNS